MQQLPYPWTAPMLIDRDTKRCPQCKKMFLPRIAAGIMADSHRWIDGGDGANLYAYVGNVPFEFEVELRGYFDELMALDGHDAAHLFIGGLNVIAHIPCKEYCSGYCERKAAGSREFPRVERQETPESQRIAAIFEAEMKDAYELNNRAGRRGASIYDQPRHDAVYGRRGR